MSRSVKGEGEGEQNRYKKIKLKSLLTVRDMITIRVLSWEMKTRFKIIDRISKGSTANKESSSKWDISKKI